MGWLTGLKAIGGFLLGGTGSSPTQGVELIKGVGGWIDNLQYTEQEKAVDAAGRAVRYGQFFVQTMEENSERSKTRRSLSLLVIRWWLGMLTLSGLMFKIDLAWSQYLFEIATLTGVVTLVLGIGAFFWGTHLLRGTAKT